MEDTLRVLTKNWRKNHGKSLNPCFNGRYSQSPKFFENEDDVDVLILVLMEDTLRAAKAAFEGKQATCLNPCFNGRYSQRTRKAA